MSTNVIPSDGFLDIKTFIFLDMETTGLPSEEHNKTKMIELSMIAVQADHICLGVFPRVQNKLNLCFNPRKMVSFRAEELTGLSNELLENQNSFSSSTVSIIDDFISQNQSPVCMVAHNGNNFDYPILKAEINKTKCKLARIFCIDSLVFFQEMHLEERRKYEINKDTIDSSSTVPLEYTDEYDKLLMMSQDVVDFDKVAQVKRTNETTPVKQLISAPSRSLPAKKVKLNSATRRVDFGVSFKLGDLYQRFTKKTPINAHQAESDVLMLITCAATMGDKFVDWANKNAKEFCDIPGMTPGRKIGT